MAFKKESLFLKKSVYVGEKSKNRDKFSLKSSSSSVIQVIGGGFVKKLLKGTIEGPCRVESAFRGNIYNFLVCILKEPHSLGKTVCGQVIVKGSSRCALEYVGKIKQGEIAMGGYVV